jgi:DNA-binding MarR family transcriptional regulator
MPGDRRVRTVELTTEGPEVFGAAHVTAARINDELFAHFSRSQQDQLMKLLPLFAFPPD